VTGGCAGVFGVEVGCAVAVAVKVAAGGID
jgi:hypothetical protein